MTCSFRTEGGATERLDTGKLSKICEMFGSDHTGERAAAAHKAHQLVRAAGLQWKNVFFPARPDRFCRQEVHLTPGDILARHGHALSNWERSFLSSLVRQHGRTSPKQTNILAELRQRFTGGV